MIKILSELLGTTIETEKDGKELEPKAIEDAVKAAFAAKLTAVEETAKKTAEATTAAKYDNLLKPFEGETLEDKVKGINQRLEAKKDTKLTKETLKDNEVVKALIEESVTALKTKLEDTETAFNSFKTEATTKEKREAIKAAIRQGLGTIKARLGEDEETKNKRIAAMESLMLQNLDAYKVDGKDIILLDGKGEPLKDKYHNPIQFIDRLKETNPFGVHEFDPKKSGSGATKNGSTPTTSYNFNSYSDLQTFLNTETDGGKRADAMKAYREAQQN